MSEFQTPETRTDYSFEPPEADDHIWAREEQKTLLGRPLTSKEENELWETGEVCEGETNAQ